MATIDIPAAARKKVYFIFAVIGVAIGATTVAYATAELGQPVWLRVIAAVFTFVAGAVGYVAGSNTYPDAKIEPVDPVGLQQDDLSKLDRMDGVGRHAEPIGERSKDFDDTL